MHNNHIYTQIECDINRHHKILTCTIEYSSHLVPGSNTCGGFRFLRGYRCNWTFDCAFDCSFSEVLVCTLGCALSGGAVASVSAESATGAVAVFSPPFDWGQECCHQPPYRKCLGSHLQLPSASADLDGSVGVYHPPVLHGMRLVQLFLLFLLVTT